MFSPSPTKQHDHWSISWILQCAFIKSPTRNAASKKVLRVGVKSSLVCTICTSPWHIAVHTINISLSLWFGDINTEIQMTMQRSSVGQSTHLSLAAADKGSILIQDNCWLSTGDQTSRLHISTDLLFPSLKCELTLTLDEPRQYLEKSDILQTKAILILDPYPLFWLLSVIAPVFSFCFSSEIFQENVWCILLTKLLQKHFWLLCNGRLSM